LYVGATLMIGASIYGFVDYKKTSHKKEFTTMYDENKKAPLVVEDNKATKPVVNKNKAGENKETANNEKKVTVKEKNTTTSNSNVEKKKKKKKRFNPEIFSRAPIREEVIEIAEPVKPEVKKAENKEQ